MEEFFTKQALRARTGLDIRTIERAIARGDLAAFRVGHPKGGRVMIRERDARAWLTRTPIAPAAGGAA